jgi:hypothetical protein
MGIFISRFLLLFFFGAAFTAFGFEGDMPQLRPAPAAGVSALGSLLSMGAESLYDDE